MNTFYSWPGTRIERTPFYTFIYVCMYIYIYVCITLSTEKKFSSKFFRKRSFCDQNQLPLNNVEPFDTNLRALFIAQCPYRFSSFLDLRNASTRLRLHARDFWRFQFFFSLSACFLQVPPPPKFAKLSKIWWEIWTFWKGISVDQIQCGGEGKDWIYIKWHIYRINTFYSWLSVLWFFRQTT